MYFGLSVFTLRYSTYWIEKIDNHEKFRRNLFVRGKNESYENIVQEKDSVFPSNTKIEELLIKKMNY